MNVQYYLLMETLTPTQWISQCAARLHERWPTVGREQLEEVAIGIWQDGNFRQKPPIEAATTWLQPVTVDAPAPYNALAQPCHGPLRAAIGAN